MKELIISGLFGAWMGMVCSMAGFKWKSIEFYLILIPAGLFFIYLRN